MGKKEACVSLVAQSEYLDGSPGGISKYCSEQIRNISRLAPKNTKIKTIRIGNYPWPFGILSTKFSGFGFNTDSGIIHNLTERPLIPLRRKASVLINAAHEFQRILYPKITMSEGRLLTEMPEYLIKKSYMWDILKGDCIVATSSQTKREARKLGFDKEVFVVNPGISEEFLNTPKSVTEKRDFVVGYVGAIRKRKGVEMLIESMSYLDQKFKLKMYGMVFSRFREDFNRIMKKAKNTEYCGVVPKSRIVGVYDSFDAFVIPSWYEGFGMGIVEAQSRGIPVVVNGKGMLPYETSRYCFKANDASRIADILQGIKDNGYNAKSMRIARSYARGFTWEKTAKETIEVYKRFIS